MKSGTWRLVSIIRDRLWLHPSQTRMLEVVRVLQPITKHPIHAGMSKEYDPRKTQYIISKVPTSQQYDHSNTLMMKEIVTEGTHPRIDHVTDHTYVWKQQERRVPPPAKWGQSKEVDRKAKHSYFFEFQEVFHTGDELN